METPPVLFFINFEKNCFKKYLLPGFSGIVSNRLRRQINHGKEDFMGKIAGIAGIALAAVVVLILILRGC